MTPTDQTAGELPYLSQANFVGVGFDITGVYAIPDGLLLPVVDPEKAGRTTFDFLGTTYSIPAYIVPALDTYGRFVEDASETREEMQNSFSITAKVEVGYGAFSGEMEASYGRQYASSSEHSFAYLNFYSRLGVLSLALGKAQEALSSAFVTRCEELPKQVNETTLEKFEEFFHDFGVYVTSRVSLGASLEYYSAVDKSSLLTTTTISAHVKAEYRGLFATGSFSTDITKTDSWKSYAQNRTVNISVVGGDPDVVATLAGVDASAPSATTVDVYKKWTQSITDAPAVADFELIGIWELIRDPAKRETVSQAFAELHGAMRPRLVVETSASSKHNWPPTITLGSVIRPEQPPRFPIGYQLVMIDRSEISPDGVRLDRYYGVPDQRSYAAYEDMYDEIATDIEEGGFEGSQIVMVLASYGISSNAPPNVMLYPLLKAAGAGAALEHWIQRADPGSSMDGNPGSYILVGVGALGPDTGAELIRFDRGSISLEVFFYRQRGAKYYTLSVGARQGGALSGESVRRDFIVKQPTFAWVDDASE